MANFGSRKLGFYTSVGGGSGGGQNLQQTLGYGDNTTNKIRMVSVNDNNNILSLENNIIDNVVNGTNIKNRIQGNQFFMSNDSNELSILQPISLQLQKNNNSNILTFNSPNVSAYHTLPNYSGTLAMSQMLETDEISIDGITYDLGDNGVFVNFNCYFNVTRANGTINFVTSGIAQNVPFYLCINDGLNYTLNFTADGGSTPVRPFATLINTLGLVTIIWNGASIFIQ